MQSHFPRGVVRRLFSAGVGTLALICLAPALAAAPPVYNEQALKDDYHRFLGSLDAMAFSEGYPAAIQELMSGETHRQMQALQTLAGTGRLDAIAWIVPHLDSPDPQLRIRAGESLDRIVEHHVLQRRDLAHPDVILIRPLTPGDPDLRPLAWIILQMFRAPDDGNTHAYAAAMTRYLELTQFRPELIEALDSPHHAVRQRAAWAIDSLDRQIDYNEAGAAPHPPATSRMLFDGRWVTPYSREWTDDYHNYRREVYYAYLDEVRHPRGHVFRAEILHGPFRSHDRQGRLKMEATYHHGLREGPFTVWGPEDSPTDTGFFRASEYHGLYRQWAPDGRRMREENYDEGVLHGEATWWDADENLLTTGEYRDGEPWDGTFPIYDEDGEAWVIRTFDDGQMTDEQPLTAPWWW